MRVERLGFADLSGIFVSRRKHSPGPEPKGSIKEAVNRIAGSVELLCMLSANSSEAIHF
jgi:hypothetical protein